MKFVNKPQDEIINLEGLSPKKVTHIVVENDKEACDKLLKEMEGVIYSCKNLVYIKTKSDSIWTNEDVVVDREIVNTIMSMDIVTVDNFGRHKTYSKDITGVRTLLSLIKYTAPINNELIETIRKCSKGKVFFKDGVYDFSINKFRQETEADMTPIRINRNYPHEINTEAKEELTTLINSIFEDEKQSLNMLQHGARGMAGCIEDKDFVIGTGLRDCGKGILTQLFMQSFGVYTSDVNPNNFLGTKRVGSSDEAKNRMWLIPHMWSRLIFANECDIDNGNEKAVINGVLIKSLMSGGDVQRARIIFKTEIEFIFNGRLMLFMNDLPEIKPVDTCQHMTLFEFPNKFIMPSEYNEKKANKDLQPYEKKADPNLKEKLKDEKYINAFIRLVFENYKNEPVKNSEEVTNTIKEYRIDAGDELLFFKECFDISDQKAFTPSTEVYEAVNAKYPEMSQIKIKSFLIKKMRLKYSQKKINGERARGFWGLKIKETK
jgi:phage/plasmid-associated DNA primase